VSLSHKLGLAFAALSLTIVMTVGWFAFADGRRTIERNTRGHVAAINLLKAEQFNAWIDSNRYGLQRIAQRPLICDYTRQMITAEPGTAAYSEAYTKLYREHLTQLIEENLGFHELFILHPETGVVLVSSDESHTGLFRESQPYYMEGRTATFVQNAYYLLSEQQQIITMATPIAGCSDRPVGVLAGNLDFDAASAIMLSGFLEHETGDTFLVNTFNFFVTDSRFAQDFDQILAVYSDGVTDCLQGNTGTLLYRNHYGVEVIGAYRWIAERELCIVTEVAEAEAFAPVIALRANILVISGLVALIGAAAGLLLAGTISRPIQRLVQGTEIIGQGNLDHSVAIQSSDEVGALSRAFDRMVQNLKLITASRDELDQEIQRRKQVEQSLREREQALERMGADLRERVKELACLRDIGAYEDDMPLLTDYFEQVAARIPTSMQYPEVCIAAIEFEQQIYGMTIAAGLSCKLSESIVVEGVPAGRLHVGYTEPHAFLDEEGAHVQALVDRIERYITRRRLSDRLQEAMAQFERSNQELQQFAYVASHDLQEPLRMVTSYLQLLQRRYKDKLDEDADQFIAYAVDGATRMRTLINDLLAFSRVTSRGKEFRETDLNSVIAKTLKDLEIRIEETSALITCDELPTIEADESQMCQLFLNLLSNAIKFRGDQQPHIRVAARRDIRHWEFCVRDNGIGIEPEYFDRIFVIFQRLHSRDAYEGTGIGLAVCKRIVERHNGRIWVESEPGSGTAFYFTIPYEKGNQHA
jgi:signal transduction histidine kinase/HAMP domain-containing protein